jgi:hypothetical protein
MGLWFPRRKLGWGGRSNACLSWFIADGRGRWTRGFAWDDDSLGDHVNGID